MELRHLRFSLPSPRRKSGDGGRAETASAQPSLSRQMRDLGPVGAQLMIRSARGISWPPRAGLSGPCAWLAQVDAAGEQPATARPPSRRSLWTSTGKRSIGCLKRSALPNSPISSPSQASFLRPRGCSCPREARRGIPTTRSTGNRSGVQNRRHGTVCRRGTASTASLAQASSTRPRGRDSSLCQPAPVTRAAVDEPKRSASHQATSTRTIAMAMSFVASTRGVAVTRLCSKPASVVIDQPPIGAMPHN